MAFKWPDLLYTIADAAGYPGVEVTVILNPVPVPEREYSGEGWDSRWYHANARIFRRVLIPGDYTEDGQDQVFDIEGPEDLYNLERALEPDGARILLWSINHYARIRYEARPDAVKN